MAFQDVIDNYAQDATGTLTAPTGETVGYTVTSGVATTGPVGPNDFPNTDSGAQVLQDGLDPLEVTFDVPVSGITLTFDRSNSGEVYLIIINGVTVDLNNLPPEFSASFATSIVGSTNAGTHFITSTADGGGVSSTGTFNNNSLGFLTITGPIDSIGVVGSGGGGGFDVVEIGIDSVAFDVLCFAASTEIATPDGPKAICELGAGDTVLTAAGSTARIVAVQSRHIRPMEIYRETRLSPVIIKAGALGQGLPNKDLRVSRQHRILVASRVAQRIAGATQVLIPAIKLTDLPGIDVDRTMQPIDYYHILLDCHDVVLANGAPAETLFAGPVAMRAIESESAGFSEQALDHFDVEPMHPARPMPDAQVARKLVAAHAKHQRDLLEEWECVTAAS